MEGATLRILRKEIETEVKSSGKMTNERKRSEKKCSGGCASFQDVKESFANERSVIKEKTSEEGKYGVISV